MVNERSDVALPELLRQLLAWGVPLMAWNEKTVLPDCWSCPLSSLRAGWSVHTRKVADTHCEKSQALSDRLTDAVSVEMK